MSLIIGVNANLLGRWKKEAEHPGSESTSPGSMVAMQAELKRLKKENKQLKMEREILKKKGSGLLRQGAWVSYQFIDTEKKVYPITLLCQVMEVSRSGFYSWSSRNISERKKERERLIPKVKKIHKYVRGAYGARRISEELTAKGESCGRTKAAALMQLANVSAKQKRKFKATTDSKHKLPVAPNVLDRNFVVSQPDAIYCSDITYIWTSEG
nr:IS3 family transposase [Desulfosediminicola flagellatus]